MIALLATLALADEPLIVATHPVPPFVIHGADGQWSGISIDLWRQVAADAGLSYEIRELPVPDLVPAAERGDVDVVVSLNITAERERRLDLTHAFESTGLGIATRASPPGTLAALVAVLSPSFLGAVGAVALLLVGAGSAMWLLERRDNPDAFGGREGWLSGLFWALETVIGYNDPAHQTRAGRALGIAWAGFGVVVISTLTAQISAELTVHQLETTVNGPADLPRVRVGTVSPSAGLTWCERRGLRCAPYPDAAAAIGALAAGQLDAVVYEAPILAWHVKDNPELLVLPGTFENHGYGFGLAPGSPHREAIDAALLTFVQGDGWRELRARYLGPS